MFIAYDSFSQMLSQKFTNGEEFYIQLLEKIIDHPYRYTGVFRISNVETKLIQNITQSNEIKFGDFMEEIITKYIEVLGFNNLEKFLGPDESGDDLYTDQLFMDNKGNLYLVEQKIRDDHDSTKKRGQFQNFIRKVELLKKKYPDNHLIGVMWFIDDSLTKNRNYYSNEMKKYEKNHVDLRLYYGGELFEKLLGSVGAWEEIIEHLNRYKKEHKNDSLNIPDFDTSEEILAALKKISPKHKKKLLSNRPEIIQLRKELFPNEINIRKIKS